MNIMMTNDTAKRNPPESLGEILGAARESLQRPYRHQARALGLNVEWVAARVTVLLDLPPAVPWAACNYRQPDLRTIFNARED